MVLKHNYDGPDRRIYPISDRRDYDGHCYAHSGLVQRISSIEDKTKDLEGQGFLTLANYWWTTGVLVSIFVAVVSASVYVTFQAGQALREIKSAQDTLSIKISYLQKEIEALQRKMP